MQSLVLIVTAMAAAVQAGDPERAVTKDLVACRAIAAADARLACFDRAASVITDAVASNRIRIVDPEKQKKQQSARFGLVQSHRDESRFTHMEGRLASSTMRSDGRLVLVLADGSSWRQVDDYPLRRTPHAGDPVVIDLTSLGSYRLRVGREAAIRVRRADRS